MRGMGKEGGELRWTTSNGGGTGQSSLHHITREIGEGGGAASVDRDSGKEDEMQHHSMPCGIEWHQGRAKQKELEGEVWAERKNGQEVHDDG